MKPERFCRHVVVFLFLIFAGNAQAVLDIEITRGVEGALPIAIVPFAIEGTVPPEKVDAIVNSDLARSGYFNVIADDKFPQVPRTPEGIVFDQWRSRGIENIVIGSVTPKGPGNYQVRFQLFNTASGRQLIGYNIPSTERGMRKAAHKISDLIFEALTGLKGAFGTRVAYISTQKKNNGDKLFFLQVADADGFNPSTIFKSTEPLMSPAWSPDGRRIAYVSFENKRSSIFVQDLVTGKRSRVPSKPGINSAPAWSPDGKRLAMTLSVDGNPEIYMMDVGSGRLTRLTRSSGIDTEPKWMPDGLSLLYTSDRSGRPQIYRVAISGGRPERVTFEGRYNADVDVSPDGKRITMVHGTGGGFRVAVMDLDTGALRVVTDGRLDEAPSFAPNGSMIIYATESRGRQVLSAVSADGRVRQRLRLQEGGVREPVWSPFRK